MGITGAWAAAAQVDYTGATRGGTGVNPIHAIQDSGIGRVTGVKETLLPLGANGPDAVNPEIVGELDWVPDAYDEAMLPGESYRYTDDYPRFDQPTESWRDSTVSPAMGEQVPWGVYNDSDPSGIWPLPGPTGGMDRWLDVDHGEVEEQNLPINVPTPNVTGGWLNKARGAPAQAMAQEPADHLYQLAINTTPVQGPGVQEYGNDRAVLRGTDGPRSAIRSPVVGIVERAWAQSIGMGGGPGAPDMQPYQQTAGLRRPWYPRRPALPPPPDTFFGTMEMREPLARTVPPDPYQGEQELDPSPPEPELDGAWY
jgi:hypothetical protein